MWGFPWQQAAAIRRRNVSGVRVPLRYAVSDLDLSGDFSSDFRRVSEWRMSGMDLLGGARLWRLAGATGAGLTL